MGGLSWFGRRGEVVVDWKDLGREALNGFRDLPGECAALLVAERPHDGSRGFQPTERDIPALPRRVATLVFTFTNAILPIRLSLGWRPQSLWD